MIFRINILPAMAEAPGKARARRASTRGALIALAASAVLAGCGGRLPAPTTADATRAQETWKDATVAELEHGRHLYVERCSACHALYEPVRFPASRWPSLVDRMSARARLVSTDGQAVTRYLVVMAQSPGPSPSHAQ